MAHTLGHQQLSLNTSGVQSLTVPSGAQWAEIQAETANVRYCLDGQHPSTTFGMLAIAAAAPIAIRSILSRARFIAASGSPKLNVTYYGSRIDWTEEESSSS